MTLHNDPQREGSAEFHGTRASKNPCSPTLCDCWHGVRNIVGQRPNLQQPGASPLGRHVAPDPYVFSSPNRALFRTPSWGVKGKGIRFRRFPGAMPLAFAKRRVACLPNEAAHMLPRITRRQPDEVFRAPPSTASMFRFVLNPPVIREVSDCPARFAAISRLR